MLTNIILLQGGLTHAPYFDYVGEGGRPFLRLYLATKHKPDSRVDFIRVVAFDGLALGSYPYLRKGSEVLVQGYLRTRRRQLGQGQREWVAEVVAREISFVRNVDWEAGERAAGGGM